MELNPYVTALQRQLETAAAAGGEEAVALAERLTAPLEASTRLVLLEALSAAAGEISAELAPGSVDLRLRGGEPEFVVGLPPAEDHVADAAPAPVPAPDAAATARINLRLPEELKARVEAAATAAGLSTNTWLVRALAAAVEGGGTPAPAAHPSSDRRYRGWVA